MADGAYWFDTNTGNFVSSTYYFKAMPAWAEAFNQSRKVDRWVGKEWAPVDSKPGSRPFGSLGAEPGKAYYNQLDASPFSNELLVEFAQAAIEAEQLGADEFTDVLGVSFSANDRVGHSLGPDAPEVRDISIQADRVLGRFFEYLDGKVGAGNYLAVLTADHGVAPLPEVMAKRGMPGGRMPEGAVLDAIQKALSARWGEGQWIVGKSGPAPYLNYGLIQEKKLTREEVQKAAADAVRGIAHIARVYTKNELRDAKVLHDLIDRRVANGFHYQRASDLFIVAEPYWLFQSHGTSHGTPYNYDSHVPMIFMGPGIKAGRYHGRAAVNDIAPTLATMLDVETPSGATGRVLHEMLQ
jgi:predicted AlkP superfamily pyrophosphatase or phosphodiesterase